MAESLARTVMMATRIIILAAGLSFGMETVWYACLVGQTMMQALCRIQAPTALGRRAEFLSGLVTKASTIFAINEVGYKPDQMVERSTAKRTAMVADLDTDNVYLIATENECDYIDFRAAIQSAFDITDGNNTNSRYKGIMLDGGGSAQFRANRGNGADVTIVQSRKLAEVIVLRNSN